MSYKVAMLVPEGATPRSPALWKGYAGIDVDVKEEGDHLTKSLFSNWFEDYDAVIIGAPYKTEAMNWCHDGYHGMCHKIGATNFIHKGMGYNTDSYGFGKAVEETYGFLPYDLRVLVLGAGATGRAILYWLSTRHQMDKVYVWNRTEARALKAAVDFNCNVCPTDKKHPWFFPLERFFDFIVKAAPADSPSSADCLEGTFSQSMAKHQALKAMSILFNDEKYLTL